MDRWVAGLIVSFLVVFAANGLLVWLAVSDPPVIDPTYIEAGETGLR